MRLIHLLTLAFCALPSLILAQSTTTTSHPTSNPTGSATNGNQNPISYPLGDTLKAGLPITIAWKPTFGDSVDLFLRQGKETALDQVGNIATGIPNSGSFVWLIPGSTITGNDYSIQIISGTESNYSPLFSIDSRVSSSSSSSASSTTSSTEISTSTLESSATTATSLISTSFSPSSTGSFNSSSTTMRISTSSNPPATSTSAPGIDQVTSINTGAVISLSFSLLFTLAASLVYLS